LLDYYICELIFNFKVDYSFTDDYDMSAA